jgi:hypothetical protein
VSLTNDGMRPLESPLGVAGLLTEESNKVALIARRVAYGEVARLSGDRVAIDLSLQFLGNMLRRHLPEPSVGRLFRDRAAEVNTAIVPFTNSASDGSRPLLPMTGLGS